jgi:hypothetical protein
MDQSRDAARDLVFDLLAAITNPIPSEHAQPPTQIAAHLITALENSWGPEALQQKMNGARARLEAKARALEQEEALDGFLKGLDEVAGVGKSLKEEATSQHQERAASTPEGRANTRKRKRDLCDDLDRKMEDLENLRKKLKLDFAVDTEQESAGQEPQVPSSQVDELEDEDWAVRISASIQRSSTQYAQAAAQTSSHEATLGFETQTVGPLSRSPSLLSIAPPSAGCVFANSGAASSRSSPCASPTPTRTSPTPADYADDWECLSEGNHLSKSTSPLLPTIEPSMTPLSSKSAPSSDHADEWERVGGKAKKKEHPSESTPVALTSSVPSNSSPSSQGRASPLWTTPGHSPRESEVGPQLTERLIDKLRYRLFPSHYLGPSHPEMGLGLEPRASSRSDQGLDGGSDCKEARQEEACIEEDGNVGFEAEDGQGIIIKREEQEDISPDDEYVYYAGFTVRKGDVPKHRR